MRRQQDNQHVVHVLAKPKQYYSFPDDPNNKTATTSSVIIIKSEDVLPDDVSDEDTNSTTVDDVDDVQHLLHDEVCDMDAADDAIFSITGVVSTNSSRSSNNTNGAAASRSNTDGIIGSEVVCAMTTMPSEDDTGADADTDAAAADAYQVTISATTSSFSKQNYDTCPPLTYLLLSLSLCNIDTSGLQVCPLRNQHYFSQGALCLGMRSGPLMGAVGEGE